MKKAGPRDGGRRRDSKEQRPYPCQASHRSATRVAPVGAASRNSVKIHPIARLRWIEMINHDPDVPAMAVRVAIFIGKHWENNSGQCHIAQETIAEALDISVRYVSKMTKVLQKRGHLGVSRSVNT
jgi:hypothetical protein